MGTKVFDNALDLITFTRASGGTALRRIGYGPELVTNGTFDTDSDWSSISGWDNGTISAGQITVSTVGFVGAAQPISGLTVGGSYIISVEVVAVPSGTARLYVGAAGSPGTSAVVNRSGLGAGVHTFTFVATATSHAVGLSSTSSDTAGVVWDNISVKEVLFDRASDPLVLFNHPTNVPRIEYDASGAVKGLLIEEARTNLLTYSNDFTNAAWGNTNSVDSLTAVGPDGATSATTLSDNNTGGTGSCDLTVAATVATSTVYTWSTFAKASGSSFLYLWGRLFTTPANGGVWFNLSNGTVGTQQTGWSGTIQDFGNGWYRCSVTFTTDAADTAGQLRIGVADADNDPAATLDGTSSILIYGAQLEAGAFPTSYIPTAGATATRAADIASIPTSAFGYNPRAGSLVVESSSLAAVAGDFNGIVVLGANSSNRVNLGQIGDDGYQIISEGGVTVVLYNEGVSHNTNRYPAGVQKKTGIAFNGSSAVAGLDGQIGTEDTSVVVPVATEMRIGYDYSLRYRNGHIRSITYYPRRLSNAQLQELTT